ncbi:MAG TPA: hypothetical protein VHQ90_23635 [Thermoanaerobaculia bacterium]|nr:hypothetical protein [Thermoanaerobaculia bacterium]
MKRSAAFAILGLLWAVAASAASMTVPLLAHSTIVAGTVTVSNTDTFVMVTYMTTGDWTILSADLAVATSLAGIPQTSSGNPDIGRFPYHATPPPMTTTFTFTVPLPGGMANKNGTPLYIAAHALLTSPTQGKKHAWGAGLLFPGSRVCTPTGRGGGDGEHHDGEGHDGEHSGDHNGDHSGDGEHHDGDNKDCNKNGDGEHRDDAEGQDCDQQDSEHHDGEHHDGEKGDDHKDGDHHDSGSQDSSKNKTGDHSGDKDHHDGDKDHHEGDKDHEGDKGNQACVPCGATYFIYTTSFRE